MNIQIVLLEREDFRSITTRVEIHRENNGHIITILSSQRFSLIVVCGLAAKRPSLSPFHHTLLLGKNRIKNHDYYYLFSVQSAECNREICTLFCFARQMLSAFASTIYPITYSRETSTTDYDRNRKRLGFANEL